MARFKLLHVLSASGLGLVLAMAPAGVALAQTNSPGGCGTPAIPATPADPGAPGDGATRAQPAQPAQPAKCPDEEPQVETAVLGVSGSAPVGASSGGAAARGTTSARVAQAGADGVIGSADDVRPSMANTGFGGTASDPSGWALPMLAAAGLALLGSLGARRLARPQQA